MDEKTKMLKKGEHLSAQVFPFFSYFRIMKKYLTPKYFLNTVWIL